MAESGEPCRNPNQTKPSEEARAPTFADPAVESFPLRYEEEIATALERPETPKPLHSGIHKLNCLMGSGFRGLGFRGSGVGLGFRDRVLVEWFWSLCVVQGSGVCFGCFGIEGGGSRDSGVSLDVQSESHVIFVGETAA